MINVPGEAKSPRIPHQMYKVPQSTSFRLFEPATASDPYAAYYFDIPRDALPYALEHRLVGYGKLVLPGTSARLQIILGLDSLVNFFQLMVFNQIPSVIVVRCPIFFINGLKGNHFAFTFSHTIT